jgi:multicomponent Na+:H+ antiporter subunit C
MIEIILAKYNYWIYIALMMVGFYAMIAKENLIKKVIGMNIFQTGVILLYVSISKISGGTVPIIWDTSDIYDNPLPHVLMLTAIVVSVSTTAVALALIIRIYKSYGTMEDDQIVAINRDHNDTTDVGGGIL